MIVVVCHGFRPLYILFKNFYKSFLGGDRCKLGVVFPDKLLYTIKDG